MKYHTKKALKVLSSYKCICIIPLMTFSLICSCYAADFAVTLQWAKSIDDPYIDSYKVYYYPISRDPKSLKSVDDYADSYQRLDGLWLPILSNDPITIPKTDTLTPLLLHQITLHFSGDRIVYYFVVTAYQPHPSGDDKWALESIPTPEVCTIMKGDVNGDCVVNIDDAILALKVIARLPNPTDVTIHPEADVNGDGKIGLPEAIYILQVAAELRSSPR